MCIIQQRLVRAAVVLMMIAQIIYPTVNVTRVPVIANKVILRKLMVCHAASSNWEIQVGGKPIDDKYNHLL